MPDGTGTGTGRPWRLPWLLLLLLFCSAFLTPAASAAGKPNILIILADDCTFNDLPFYGGKNARTPHLGQLASEGLVFDRAYLGMAMCQPSRAELFTGQSAFRNGCAWNHSACRPGTRSLPHYLQEAGYRVGIAGKTHLVPEAAFPFEKVSGYDSNCVRNPTLPHDPAGLRQFITRDPAQPFCLVVALTEPHVPWVMGDSSAYPPGQIQLPPNLAGTARTREDFSRYLAEISYMDRQTGEILALLEDTGNAGGTLVLFSSEQGSQFPGNKWNCWDTGLHTALIARWPGVVKPGQRTRELVQYTDILPTLIEIAGTPPVPWRDGTASALDGRSFAAVLRGSALTEPRRYVHGLHHNYPEGPPYAIRTVSDGDWRLIRNLTPDRTCLIRYIMGASPESGSYWNSWMARAWDQEPVYRLVHRVLHRPAVELYHTAEDPYELHNLAADPAHAATLARLDGELSRWLAAQGDPGSAMDTPQAHAAAKSGRHLNPPPPLPAPGASR